MHTALLTEEAKRKLTTLRENIKSRVKTLLTEASTSSSGNSSTDEQLQSQAQPENDNQA
jgi:hypothetical protein